MRRGYVRAVRLLEILAKIEPVLAAQGRLLVLPEDRCIVYVGDTHGDADAAAQVLERFARPNTVIVFLGDTVDRGPDSEGTLALILEAKRDAPEAVHLLMGNHEAWAVSPFAPADFWMSLPQEEARTVGGRLLALPFAAWHPRGILALHGALPDVCSVEEIAQIRPGSTNWRRIAWGDWEPAGAEIPVDEIASRPAFGAETFATISARLGVKVLVRSHQPTAPTYLYGGRCLTLFTSCAYGSGERRVAILKPEVQPETGRDLALVSI